MMRTIPEADAELLTADDVHRDVQSLTASLQRRKAELQAYAVLSRPEVSKLLKTLIASGVCTSEADAIERGLKTLLTATSR